MDASPASRCRFPRSARVLARADFDRIFQQGRRTGAPLLSLHRLAEEVSPRLGLAVSRKVDPRAVGRNRIKRVLRDAFRRQRDALPPGSYVIVARPAARGVAGADLRNALVDVLRRAGALPAPGAPGTMPDSPPSTEPAPTSRRAG